MTALSRKHCTACRADAPKLNAGQISELRKQIPDWDVITDDSELKLRREFKFDNFMQALNFTVQIAELAEAEDHHPTLITEWGKVTVLWWTHKIQGLHENDFIMALQTDEKYASIVG